MVRDVVSQRRFANWGFDGEDGGEPHKNLNLLIELVGYSPERELKEWYRYRVV